MIEELYHLYIFQKKIIKRANELWDRLPEDEKDFFEDLKLTHTILEEKNPEYLQRYERELNGTSLLPE